MLRHGAVLDRDEDGGSNFCGRGYRGMNGKVGRPAKQQRNNIREDMLLVGKVF